MNMRQWGWVASMVFDGRLGGLERPASLSTRRLTSADASQLSRPASLTSQPSG